jgi:hypothetical protein
VTAQAFPGFGCNMLCHHRLMYAFVAVPTPQRSGHLSPTRLKFSLRALLGSHSFSRQLAGLRDLPWVPTVMFPQRCHLLIGSAFELVLRALIAALRMVFLARGGSENELDLAALAGCPSCTVAPAWPTSQGFMSLLLRAGTFSDTP